VPKKQAGFSLLAWVGFIATCGGYFDRAIVTGGKRKIVEEAKKISYTITA